MLDESSYLPYTAGQLPQGPWLVISPHPDDETFGLGGAIILAAEQGFAVDVLFLTSGDKGGAEGIAPIRENEALAASRVLKIREVSFWRLPDRSLLTHAPIIDKLAEVIASTQPGSVFFPSPVEPHPDHRASSVIAWEALRKTGFTAEPWSYEISVQGPVNRLIDISHVISQKREIMGIYASQMSQNNYVGRIIALNQARAWSLPVEVSHAEAFYAWSKANKPINALLLELQTQTVGIDALPGIMPTVSVIIRTKNRPKSLREAIVSVANQTYQDIELVVINDGGEDVQTIVSDYAINNIQRVIYHSCPAGVGRAAAANVGLEKAQGEWLMFLDDDDSIFPSHIATLLSKAQLRPYPKVVYSGVRGIDAHGHESHLWNEPYSLTRLLRANFLPIHAVLFQRSLLGKDIRFDTSFEIYEDWDFWSQLAHKTPFISTNEITATYYLCGDSGTQNDREKQARGRLQYYAKWLPLLTANELNDSLVEANVLCDHVNYYKGLASTQVTKTNELELEYADLTQRYNDQEAKLNQLQAEYAVLAQRYHTLELDNHKLSSTHPVTLSAATEIVTQSMRTFWQVLRRFSRIGRR